MVKELQRTRYIERLEQQLRIHAVCGLLGPRQCGKTTLARDYADKFDGDVHWFDLENPDDLESLSNPMRTLENLTGLVVLDEVQRAPELFPILRVLVDRKQAKYMALGSASRDLLQQSSETLAGRIGYIEMAPFHLKEGVDTLPLLVRGGYPLSYLANSDEESYLWRESYIRTFLERDLAGLGFNVPPMTMRRFWSMLTHINAQQLNLHQLGMSLGVSGHSVRSYLDVLAGTFMIRVLQPWHENLGKRQVKTPKVYFRDTGILLALMRVLSYEELLRHPALGAVWEGFALEQVFQSLEIDQDDAYFWRTSQGAELDLFIDLRGRRYGFEFKFGDAPSRTKSMQIAKEDLRLDHLYVVYPGSRSYPLDDRLSVIGIESIRTLQLN